MQNFVMRAGEIPVLLKKYLADCTYLKYNEIENVLADGRVAVNGSRKLSPKMMIFPQEDAVHLDDRQISPDPPLKRSYFAFHKPAGFESILTGRSGDKSLDRWMMTLPQGISNIGRLDKATTGLLILTNDGDLNHAIRIKGNVTKEYALTLQEKQAIDLDDSRIQSLLQDVKLEDGSIAKATSISIATVVPPTERWGFTQTIVHLGISEGSYHIVRRMCRAAHLRLAHLHRFRVGNISLMAPDGTLLPEGSIRELTSEEVEDLWRIAGGRDQIAMRRISGLAGMLRRSENTLDDTCVRIKRWFAESNITPDQCSFFEEIEPD